MKLSVENATSRVFFVLSLRREIRVLLSLPSCRNVHLVTQNPDFDMLVFSCAVRLCSPDFGSIGSLLPLQYKGP